MSLFFLFKDIVCNSRNTLFENVTNFRYLETTLTDQNFTDEEVKSRLNSENVEEVKSRLNSGDVCYYSAQNLLFSGWISKNIRNKIYRKIILPVVLYVCEAWSLTLREKHRSRAFENRVLRRIFGP